jgi:hypothetical protein
LLYDALIALSDHSPGPLWSQVVCWLANAQLVDSCTQSHSSKQQSHEAVYHHDQSLVKALCKPPYTRNPGPFRAQDLPVELLLVIFDFLPVRDLYRVSAIEPSNALSNHAKATLLNRVFGIQFLFRITWCCCSCARSTED